MQFLEIIKEPVIEEEIRPGDKICFISVDQPGTFTLDSEHPDWYSMTIGVNNSCNIYITTAGVGAINQDFPDAPENEVTTLDFVISVTDNDTNITISEPVTISVTRIHDSEPLVIGKYIDHIFTQNLYDNMRVASISTAYDSSFNVINSYSNYFYFDNNPTNVGYLLLSPSGVNYLAQDLIWENNNNVYEINNFPVQDLVVDVYITDSENGKSITDTLTLTIFKGDKEYRLPTKNNAELTAEHLGNYLGNENGIIESDILKLKYTAEYLKDHIDAVFDEVLDNNNDIEDLKKRIENILERFLESDTFQDEKEDMLLNSLSGDLFESIYTILDKHLIFKQERDHEELIKNINSNVSSQFISKANFESTEDLLKYLWIFIKFWTEARVGFTLKHMDDKVNDYAETIKNTLIPKLNERLHQIYTDFDTTNNILKNALQSIYNLDKRVKVNNGWIADNYRTIHDDLLKRDLTDWPVLDSNGNTVGWDFDTYDLKYGPDSIIRYTGTDGLFFGGTDTLQLKLKNSNGRVVFGGDTMQIYPDGAESKVIADIFEGTSTSAEYADIAELYLLNNPDLNIPGLVLSIETNENSLNEVCLYDINKPLAGVISTNPGSILNSKYLDDPSWVLIALKGRVPVLVANNTKIKKGMYIYPSPVDLGKVYGTYVRNDNNLNLIGIALENQKDDKVLIKI